MKNFLALIALLLFSSSISANSFCKNELEGLPILQNGRIKPLYVHAGETIKSLTGKTKVGSLSAVEAYCLLSAKSLAMPTSVELAARIDHVDLKKFLGLSTDQQTINYEELINKEEMIRNEALQIRHNDSYRKSIEMLFGNLMLYKEIVSGQNWMLAENINNQIQWQPLNVYLSEFKVIEQTKKSANDPLYRVLINSKLDFDRIDSNHKYNLELKYAKAGLPSWALLFSIAALATMVLFKNFKISLFISILSIVIQIALITLRVLISGRAPITNMYETVLFSGFGALFLSLILGHFKKEKVFVFMGLGYNVCTLMMLNFANGMLSASISPLVPVLRDNFWLSTHVTSIILSYGALALSWILANTLLIKRRWGNLSQREELDSSNIIYTTLKWGTTLLAAGIILGGVWADYSWGRFWGWDPKETWSLIVLCIYIAILHGRYTSWIKPDRFITFTAGAFMSVMMAWFGVNYILASGLHSYGFSEGGAIFLFSFFLAQTSLIIITLKKKKMVMA